MCPLLINVSLKKMYELIFSELGTPKINKNILRDLA